MHTVYIDGAAGTTGLRLSQRLKSRADITLLAAPEALRRDPATRRDLFAKADIAMLCLPDDAAREAVDAFAGSTRIIDASTAHRTQAGWVYGLPELNEAQAGKIASAARVAVPGCHASGFVLLTTPLLQAGLLNVDEGLSCFSVTGYSGGGKQMIAQYEAVEGSLQAPRQYALGQTHKHLKEMQHWTGVAQPPVFCPVVGPFYCGLLVTVPLQMNRLRRSIGINELRAVMQAYYQNHALITVCDIEEAVPDGFLAADALAGRDDLQLFVTGNDERALLHARYDNLGKGASGAAVQCLNLMLGVEQTTGLVLA